MADNRQTHRIRTPGGRSVLPLAILLAVLIGGTYLSRDWRRFDLFVGDLWQALRAIVSLALPVLDEVSIPVVLLALILLLRKELPELLTAVRNKVDALQSFRAGHYEGTFKTEPRPGGESQATFVGPPPSPDRPTPTPVFKQSLPPEAEQLIVGDMERLDIAPANLSRDLLALLSTLVIHEEAHAIEWPNAWGMYITKPEGLARRFRIAAAEGAAYHLIDIGLQNGKPLVGLSIRGRAFCRKYRDALQGDFWSEAELAKRFGLLGD